MSVRTRLLALAMVGLVASTTAAGCASSSSEVAEPEGACATSVPTPPTTSAHYTPASSVGVVVTTGGALPRLPDSGDDPAVGCAAPIVDGQTFSGDPIRIGGATSKPTLVFIGAHWCPHCNEELPTVISWIDEHDVTAEADVVLVSTGIDRNGDNYPPKIWIEKKLGWTFPVLVDDLPGHAREALGLTAYPMLMVLDPQGIVRFRAVGRFDLDGLETLIGDLGKGSGS